MLEKFTHNSVEKLLTQENFSLGISSLEVPDQGYLVENLLSYLIWWVCATWYSTENVVNWRNFLNSLKWLNSRNKWDRRYPIKYSWSGIQRLLYQTKKFARVSCFLTSIWVNFAVSRSVAIINATELMQLPNIIIISSIWLDCYHRDKIISYHGIS